MKILLTTDAVGGVWQYTTELAQALSARGVECVVAVLGPAPSEDQRIALVSSVLPRKREPRAKQDVARNSGFLRSQEHGAHAGKSAPSACSRRPSISASRSLSFAVTASYPNLPSTRWRGGLGSSATAMIASPARTGSPGCSPL